VEGGKGLSFLKRGEKVRHPLAPATIRQFEKKEIKEGERGGGSVLLDKGKEGKVVLSHLIKARGSLAI